MFVYFCPCFVHVPNYFPTVTCKEIQKCTNKNRKEEELVNVDVNNSGFIVKFKVFKKKNPKIS